MWINKNDLLEISLPKKQNGLLIAWVQTKNAVSNILNPAYLNSPNFIIGKKLLREKLKSWNIAWISSLLMEILTFRSEFLEEKYWKDNPNFLFNLQQRVKPQSDYYKKAINEIEKQNQKDWILVAKDNPAWFSLKTQNYSNIPNWLNYKIYLTIPINCYDFISKFYQLWLKFDELAKTTWDKISLKAPRSMLWFLSHSDSIVVHFKNPDNKDVIERMLNKWKKENWIIEEERNLWRKKFAWDSSNNSFTDLVSENIAKWILENYWKYDAGIIADLAIEYAIKQSQTPPKFKKN